MTDLPHIVFVFPAGAGMNRARRGARPSGAESRPVPSAGGDPTGRASVAADAGLLDLQRPAVRLGVDAGVGAFTAVGDAMEPTIRDGDLLVTRRLERVVAPAVYAIRTGDDIAARRLEHRVDGALIVNTDNPRHGAQVIPPGQERTFHIIGPIVWLSGPIRN